MLNAKSDADFRFIYEKIMSVIYKVSYNITKKREIAEDICHDCLIKMTEKEMVFPSIDDAKYWLIRVVRNASLNYVKRVAREKKAYQKVFKDKIIQRSIHLPEKLIFLVIIPIFHEITDVISIEVAASFEVHIPYHFVIKIFPTCLFIKVKNQITL